ncbi:MAG: hypothetical protein ACPF8V_01085 [Luteibaculum sp.]
MKKKIGIIGSGMVAQTLANGFLKEDPNFQPGKLYRVCLRLGYDFQQYNFQCNEHRIDLEPMRSCVTVSTIN